jgi:hypothetical protein
VTRGRKCSCKCSQLVRSPSLLRLDQASLMETPIMLVVIMLAARWVARRLAVSSSATTRLGVGGVTLGFLLVQEDFRRDVLEPSLIILTCVRPIAPELIVLDELGMLPIHRLPIGTSMRRWTEQPCLLLGAPPEASQGLEHGLLCHGLHRSFLHSMVDSGTPKCRRWMCLSSI